MASAQPMPPSGGEPPRAAPPPAAAKVEAAKPALVSVPEPAEAAELDDETRLSSPVARLPVELDVAIPVREFRVRDLLGLTPGRLIQSQWGHGEDVPLASGSVLLAWSEFEVVESQLAVRVTRLV
jgi:flagellar motor switch/type III secretory pathway protein FliN